MKKSRRTRVKAVICCLLCAGLLFTAACKNDAAKTIDEGASSVEVWSKSATINVMQDVAYDEDFKKPAAYTVSAARGEYEGAQIIITAPSDKAVSSYFIEAADLVCGESRIDKSYIDIYNEKYIEVISSPAEVSTGLGWYADALLPFETAVEYGENKIEAGKNQGIYIEIFIPRNVPAGEYTGNFTLTIDGETQNIPASVTVWDFEVSQESHLQTDWIVNLMAFGETDRTAEMTNTYFKAVAAYRASAHSMSSGAKDADEWLETVRTYTNPELRDAEGNPLLGEKDTYLAQINLPTAYSAETGISYTTFDTYISRLIKASIEDQYDYLAKAGAYMGFIDEPHLNNTWDKVRVVCNGWETRKAYWADIIERGDIAAINKTAGSELDGSDLSALPDGFIHQLAESMRLVGNYVTIYPDDQLDRTVTKQFCTGTSYLLKSETNMEAVHSWTEEKTSGNWWYAAGVHLFGNRLDSQPLEQRLSGWFTYDSDLQGYLIWETAQYSNIVWDSNIKVNAYNACDAYSTALRISNGAGDGYIFYPGKPYGIDGPVGSIRAHQYRDASEDYEYVYMLGQLYQEAGYSEDAILGKIFSTLYNDGRINDDSDWFDFEREQVANLILLAEKGVFVTDFSEIAGVARIQVAATGEEKIVNVNGEAAGELAQTEISVDMAAVTDGVLSFGTASGLKFEVRLNGTAKQLANADTQATVRGGEYEKAQVDGTEAAKFTFITDLSIEEDLRNNDFTYAADKEQINADIDYLAVSLYNPYDMHITVECWFMGTDNRTVYVDDIVLEPGYNEFYISRLDSVGWGTIRQITGIRFKVAPPEGMDTYTLYCLGVYAVD